MTRRTRTIDVDYLARVEGECALHIKVNGDTVEDVQLTVFEPPRFFEAFLRGRSYEEAPDLTARICGICPVAYQMSAVQAMEDALGVVVDGQLRALRRLLYCGEWIESHALHIYLLHAPDFLGYQDAIQFAQVNREAVQRGLRLKKAGNGLVGVLGGREIHPVNVRVGGFYRVPTRRELEKPAEELRWAREAALDTVRLVSTFTFPDLEEEYEFVALRHPSDYPIDQGRIVSSKGLDIPVQAYEEYFGEEHVQRSNALHSVLRKRDPYFVGPLARYNLNRDRLSPLAQEAAREGGLGTTCWKPAQGIVVRAVELVYACDEALRIIEQYEPPEKPVVPIVPRSGIGYGCTEAPRGILYHRYQIDEAGMIQDAKLVPPTAQNQKIIESDLRQFVAAHLNLPHDQLTWQCEQMVRNYDPCISCATHSLHLHLEQT